VCTVLVPAPLPHVALGLKIKPACPVLDEAKWTWAQRISIICSDLSSSSLKSLPKGMTLSCLTQNSPSTKSVVLRGSCKKTKPKTFAYVLAAVV
jgi:hypothetical protein